MTDFRPVLRAMNKTDRREWYRIENKKDEVARIDIYEAIGYDPWFDEGVGAKEFTKELREIKAARIELHINSPGGVAYDGVTIYNALRDHPAYIAVTVDGLAASAASVIAMAGDKLTMNRASELMIHGASGLCWRRTSPRPETYLRVMAARRRRVSGHRGRQVGASERQHGDPNVCPHHAEQRGQDTPGDRRDVQKCPT
jgi:ATP-dependent protease ClpP protease subunit